MTVYELVKSVPDGKRNRLMQAGIIPQQWQRYIDVYECVMNAIERGKAPFEAYRIAGEKYFTSFENVRTIIRKMKQVVDI